MKNVKVIVLLGFIVLALLAGIFSIFQGLKVKPKADAGGVQLNFAVEPAALQVGSTFNLILKTNPSNTTFNAFKLYVTFDASKVEFQNGTDPVQNISSSFSLITKSYDVQTNTMTIIGTNTSGGFSGTTDQEIARVSMKVKTGVTGDIAFQWGTATQLRDGLQVSKNNQAFTIGGGASLSPPAGSGARLWFAANKASFQPGENLDLDVMLDTNNNIVKSVDLIIPYIDPTRVMDLRDRANANNNFIVNSTSGFDPTFAVKNIDTAGKIVTVRFATTNVNGVNANNIKLGTIAFKWFDNAALNSMTSFQADQTSNVYNMQTQNILTERVVHLISIGPTGSTNSMTLNLRLKFQGIASIPRAPYNTMPVRISLKDGSLAHPVSQVGTFTAGDGGVWAGTVNFPGATSPATNYSVLIKGPKHSQRKICVNVITPEREIGTYNCLTPAVSLQLGNNSLDYTGVTLLAGDLDQDGVVRSSDISRILTNLGSTDPAILGVADVNLDGVINTQDFSIVADALSVKVDEE